MSMTDDVMPNRTQRHRDRMRAKGFRLVQMWVPDTRTETFLAEARRQSLAIGEADRHDGIMDWLEAVSEFDEPAPR